ncbi:MAG: exodeoxyribonuclease VII small subunit [Tissierellales bacterium]|jgi:exodeoxyribonuclease VII small subunit|nr:exodeoxyribonuclease VII small subunit [Tissierellales bacterium]
MEDIKSYEKYKEKLEENISKLESEEISLDEALDSFKESIELYQKLEKILTQAEKEVKVLVDGLEKTFEKGSEE